MVGLLGAAFSVIPFVTVVELLSPAFLIVLLGTALNSGSDAFCVMVVARFTEIEL